MAGGGEGSAGDGVGEIDVCESVCAEVSLVGFDVLDGADIAVFGGVPGNEFDGTEGTPAIVVHAAEDAGDFE